eukprot:scaffold73160_cov30-Tisochrysis_lutea.AAC.4
MSSGQRTQSRAMASQEPHSSMAQMGGQTAELRSWAAGQAACARGCRAATRRHRAAIACPPACQGNRRGRGAHSCVAQSYAPPPDPWRALGQPRRARARADERYLRPQSRPSPLRTRRAVPWSQLRTPPPFERLVAPG